MAYNRGNRFPPPQKCCMLLDPGAYQIGEYKKVKINKVPFLSQTPRKTTPCGKLWTHAIYDEVLLYKIPNCTSLKSKCPRFPYEAFSEEDLEALLCRCGIRDECECKPGDEEEKEEVVCQGKVPKRILIGPTPRNTTDGGLSAPSKNDRGFDLLPDGSQRRLLDKIKDESPPFYNANVHYSTDFYHGCKWSKWTGKRATKSSERRPGPADNYYVKKPSDFELCAEKFREYRRKTSKQLRFLEMVQARNILEGRPGPATYFPEYPKGHDMQIYGPKTERFMDSNIEQRPGPADHDVKRAFDLPEPPSVLCHAKLPEPSFFGVKATRFKPRVEEGPSPASYNQDYKPCHFMHCPTAAFGSSSVRFKENPVLEDYDDDIVPDDDDETEQLQDDAKELCPNPTWEFRSKTIRMKPLKRKLNEPSPADLPQSRITVERSYRLQFLAPFFTSEGRFQPWKDWMPVHAGHNTPGPCYYKLEVPKCNPAVNWGPLQRSPRFALSNNDNPAPNHYAVRGGIENILFTHNQKLKDNIKNQHEFKWEPPIETKHLSYEEREKLLLDKCIQLLNTEMDEDNKEMIIKADETKEDDDNEEGKNRKYLRSFVYGQDTPHCI